MKNQKEHTIVLDPSVEGSTEQTSSEQEQIWSNPFLLRPPREIRGFILNSLRDWPELPELTECPSAEEMARLTFDVMELDCEQLSKVLNTSAGAVALWLDPESGNLPNPSIVEDRPVFMWRDFINFWRLAMWWERERERQGIAPSTAKAKAKAKK